MADTFTITSATDGSRVELTAISRDFIAVAQVAADLSASTNVAHLGGGDGIDDYWSDLANNWRGWRGAKAWRSLEGAI